MNEALFIGLISGTSRDGVDAALVHISDQRTDLLHAICLPYPPALAQELQTLLETGAPPTPGHAAHLDEQLGHFFARATRQLTSEAGIEHSDVHAIGSHGQTVWHAPDANPPVSMQLGNGALIARTTGITTISDFRRADLRAGGQGAPLAPLLHRQLFQNMELPSAILNLGGIANLTVLAADGSVLGYDCGPANCLMDAWTMRHQQQAFDRDGAWAASGAVHQALLADLLQEPYFSTPAPKSTGLELFNLNWLDAQLQKHEVSAVDVQATLAELTAMSVAQSLTAHGELSRVLVCGGGVHNAHLVRRVQALLSESRVNSSAALGVDPDWVEAILFAWLARERLLERPQDTRAITGASRPVLLGRVHFRDRNQPNLMGQMPTN